MPWSAVQQAASGARLYRLREVTIKYVCCASLSCGVNNEVLANNENLEGTELAQWSIPALVSVLQRGVLARHHVEVELLSDSLPLVVWHVEWIAAA